MKKMQAKRLVFSGVCLALCMILPLITGQIPEIGSQLAPMHIPVLLCGFVCGWPSALLVGLIAPPLRFLLFGMPPLFPSGVGMMAELAVYGAASGLLYRRFPRNVRGLYLSLILAMLLGRLAWGAVRYLLTAFGTSAFTLHAFLAGALLNAWPGILCQLLVIPPVVRALEKAGAMR